MAVTLSVASDIANMALTYFVRGKVFEQTTQKKPLLKWLRDNQETFPGGKDNISTAVQGVFMSDTSTFFAGYSEADALTFTQGDNVLRAAYAWKEVFAGFVVSWTELKKDGITIVDGTDSVKEHSKVELTRLTSIYKARLKNFAESWARRMNTMLWADGSQDSKQCPGILSILTDATATGTTGGLSRATYAWWRHRAKIGANKLTASATDQTLTRTLRSEITQLTRYGGAPNKALCGSAFIDALALEVQGKGIYTQEGFTNKGKTDLGMAQISMMGLGNFEYDPTLDDLGFSKRCYVMDSNTLRLRPMEGEDNKTLDPVRPYDQLVFLKGMTWTGGLECIQLNGQGVYEVA